MFTNTKFKKFLLIFIFVVVLILKIDNVGAKAEVLMTCNYRSNEHDTELIIDVYRVLQ